MKPLFKQCVGIDISKSTFTACVSKYYISDLQELSEVAQFSNTKTGFNQLVKWSRKNLSKEQKAIYLMEVTGIYYESRAYYLNKPGLRVVVVLANKVKYFARSLNIKTKTDVSDARMLARMGCLQKLQPWTPHAPFYPELQTLTRFHADLIKNKVAIKNHLEALLSSEKPLLSVVNSYKKMIRDTENAMAKNIAEIEKLVRSDEQINARIKKLETIKGIGLNYFRLKAESSLIFLFSICFITFVVRELKRKQALLRSNLRAIDTLTVRGNATLGGCFRSPIFVADTV